MPECFRAVWKEPHHVPAPTLNLRSPGELAVMLPYLLGYQPGDALVLVCMRAGRVCLTACQALSPGEQLPPAMDALPAGIAKADPEGVITPSGTPTSPRR